MLFMPSYNSCFASDTTLGELSSSAQQCIAETKYSPTFGEGISFWELTPEKTKEACEEALASATDPQQTIDLLFGLSRLLLAEEKYTEAHSILEVLKEKGHPQGTMWLADRYYFGDTVEIDLKKSCSLFKTAFDLGAVKAATGLFFCYRDGWGGEQDYAKALAYLEYGAENGSSDALTELADAYRTGGEGVSEDVNKARELLISEISRQNPEALRILATIGVNTPRDIVEFSWALQELIKLEKGQSHAAPTARYNLAWMNLRKDWQATVGDKFGFVPDPEVGLRYLIDLAESALGQDYLWNLIDTELGEVLSFDQGQRLIKKLGEVCMEVDRFDRSASITSCQNVAWVLHYGVFGPKNLAKAQTYREYAAEDLGDALAAIDAGWVYWSEDSLFDPEKANYFTYLGTKSPKAIERAYAFNNLGVIANYSYELDDHLSVSRNYFEKAVEANDSSEEKIAWPYINLARFYLYIPRFQNVEKALLLAEQATEIAEGEDFFVRFIRKNNIKNSWTQDDFANALEREIENSEMAYTELGYLMEDGGDFISALKWFLICDKLCKGEEATHSSDAVARIRLQIRGADFDKAEIAARDWISARTDQKTQTELASAGLNQDHRLLLKGDIFAVLFGAENYDQFDQLRTPLNDIYDFGGVLEERYGAIVDYIENPNRADITKKLNDLARNLTPHDHLIIYFAGHGYLDDETEEGFWFPVNAAREDDTEWISNSYLKRKIRKIKATNILVIADTCFSGALISRGISTSGQQYPSSALEKYLQTKSRIVISSGGTKPVMDGGGGRNSIFASALIDRMESFERPFTASDLYLALRDQVTENALALKYDQTPMKGTLPRSGHEGPDFVLIPTQ